MLGKYNIKLIDKLNNLKESISSYLAMEKAYNLPAVCLNYGLADGEEDEAYTSKSNYVKTRLVDKSKEFLIDLAKRLINNCPLNEKGESLNEIGVSLDELPEFEFYKLTEITRRKLVEKFLEQENLSGKLDSEEFLSRANLDQYMERGSWDCFIDDYGWIKDPLINFLKSFHFNRLLDSQIFTIIELLVHPIVRDKNMVESYLNILNLIIKPDKLELIQYKQISGSNTYKVVQIDGVSGDIKNIIFASKSYKPKIVLGDALNNDIKIVENGSTVLNYDNPISTNGLNYIDLVKWWAQSLNVESSKKIANDLKLRLLESLDSKPEKDLFNFYYSKYGRKLGKELPALIPQVYLHYDPYTGVKYLSRQRMDFLILFPNLKRVVIEVDGKQHYSDGNTPSPAKYSEMVRLDRELKFLNYDIYRLGGYELTYNLEETLTVFFKNIFEKYL